MQSIGRPLFWALLAAGLMSVPAEAADPAVTAESYKAGLEKIENYDASGLMAPITVTADDHGGGGRTRIEMWDGKTWVPQTDWLASYQNIVWQVVKASSSRFKRN